MIRIFFLTFLCLLFVPKSFAQIADEKGFPVLYVSHKDDSIRRAYIFDKQLYKYRIDTLPQIAFWRKIMDLSSDSCIINDSKQRRVFFTYHARSWDKLDDSSRSMLRNNIRIVYNVDSNAKIFATVGKKFFYDFETVYHKIDPGIKAFASNGVNPWYCQAILLIESPNKLQKSNVGAYGPFQLMPGVARMYGLKVRRKIDERSNFERSAYAASSLLKNICIPRTKAMLSYYAIPYSEDDLWFKLLVMHAYHAGIENVQAVMAKITEKKEGMELIQQIWTTEAASFKNASQNYSQLICAAMIAMNERLIKTGSKIYGFNEIIRLDDAEFIMQTSNATIGSEHAISKKMQKKHKKKRL
jgi:Transglycosylase SLT domain